MPRRSAADDWAKSQRQDSGVPTGRPCCSNAQRLVGRVDELKRTFGHSKSNMFCDCNVQWTTRTRSRNGGAEHQFYEGSTLVHLHVIYHPFVLLHTNTITNAFYTCSFIIWHFYYAVFTFLADRTNGRVYATVLRPSVVVVVVCDVMYCG